MSDAEKLTEAIEELTTAQVDYARAYDRHGGEWCSSVNVDKARERLITVITEVLYHG